MRGARHIGRLHYGITRQWRWYVGVRPDWRGVRQPALTLGRLNLFWRRGPVRHTDAELNKLWDAYFERKGKP